MRDWYSSANIDDRSLVVLTKEFGAQTKGATVPRRRSLTSTGAVRTFLRLAYGTHLAQVAELVDALVSGTSGAIRGGSSPLLGTIKINTIRAFIDVIYYWRSARLVPVVLRKLSSATRTRSRPSFLAMYKAASA